MRGVARQATWDLALLIQMPLGVSSGKPLGLQLSPYSERCHFFLNVKRGLVKKSQLHQLKQLFFGQKLINMALKHVICITFS